MKYYAGERLARLAEERGMSPEYARDMRVVSAVLPFKVNEYVTDELIDWSAVPDDPIFRLTFPHRDMLPAPLFDKVAALLDGGAPRADLIEVAMAIRSTLNPHPGRQLEANVPTLDGHRLDGLQHKYAETVLVFPSQGQTCHSFCGYCFRWAQFVNQQELRQTLRDPADLTRYLVRHPEVTDVLFTGGDPMIMRTEVLRGWVEPILAEADSVRTLRFGTKALSYWPARFTDGTDASDLLRLFEQIAARGRDVAVMAHFSHPRELEANQTRDAISRVRATGAQVRAQAPLVAQVNDDPATWARMWQLEVQLGVIPYYMFVERDTGASNYFGLPLTRALDIYWEAARQVSGLARTARGPVMSVAQGKVMLHGTTQVAGERAFVLSFLQARQPEWVGRPFFAAYDECVQWYDDLTPASFGPTLPGYADGQW